MSRSIEDLRACLKLYLVMGSTNCQGDPLIVLDEAIQGGITLFQFREKGEGALVGDAKEQLARQLQARCQAHGVPFIVNDDVELAIRMEADGVHIGQDDEPADQVRQRLGAHRIVGVSAHSMAEVERAISDGADYVGIGPIYPTATKKDAKAVQGTRLIQELREQGLTIPLVGIGGITAENASDVILAGADGIAVVSAISMSTQVKQSTERLIFELGRYRGAMKEDT
ncbi:thiamine-phosphate diphosphorylase [Paenibacillus selenitireducens]|uniref:Thiamine-phosphate synthase n=1 Tax=Paenibacillus selenitireducens TaxID=1324314 RepID=A0A1T2XN20_9BACL|nr:thiamine phosphate synthase [Paenibacillus selenitireducens]OPA81264.1 thiamine-phosphate diphosphorylase [Paenibacillus selenitireducens]